jgi:hypothetical protein
MNENDCEVRYLSDMSDLFTEMASNGGLHIHRQGLQDWQYLIMSGFISEEFFVRAREKRINTDPTDFATW